ncbi:MAG: efflux RND transporter periplasmic adaptor subunit [Candidatus Omnitrophota bacterium]
MKKITKEARGRIFLKIVIGALFIFVYHLPPATYHLFAQHEGHQTQTQAKKEKAPKQKDIYYCPMHPTYTSDRPGDCPICNMKLVKKEGAQPEKASGEKTEAAGVYISPQKQQLIGVKTAKVMYRPFKKELRTVGRVAYDPDLYKAQAEYIEALKSEEKLQLAQDKTVIERAGALVEASRLKLELNGLSQEQIEELAVNKENDTSLLISSSDSEITWVYATIYEYELEYVKKGQEADIQAIAYPDKAFKGQVVAIDPVFDAMTRSVRARIKVNNAQTLLKPNMYVDVVFASDLGVKLAVPREAIMDTGVRKIVFLALPEGHFLARDVKTGVSTDDYVEIVDGIKEAEDIVVSGNFLIDSESKLKSALEGTGHQPEGDGLASGSQSHQHGQ